MSSKKQLDEQMPKPALIETPEGLTLTDGELTLRGGFATLTTRLKPQNLNGELVVKAAKIKGKAIDEEGRVYRVLDATAGMGEDSFLLAAAGFQVDLYEMDPVIGALLADALRRAKEEPALSEIAARMTFHEGDSIQAMESLEESQAPDIIFLDPMFPERKKSGMIKKKFQLLQQLEAPCADEEAMLSAAMAAHPKKIIIKRPLKGPHLAGVKPSYSLKGGKAIRYDIIVLP